MKIFLKTRRKFIKQTFSFFTFIYLFPIFCQNIHKKYLNIKRKKNKDGIWILNSLDD
tara:strand:+ start:58 stop:228 length:171 start_codon:yes stop_codon:yes gene_type:complete